MSPREPTTGGPRPPAPHPVRPNTARANAPRARDRRARRPAPRGREADGPAGPHGATTRLRTYVLLAVGEASGLTEFARPLGTLAAATRTMARAAGCVLHADVAPADLRAVAAGSAPAGYLARALALDGKRLLRDPRSGAASSDTASRDTASRDTVRHDTFGRGAFDGFEGTA